MIYILKNEILNELSMDEVNLNNAESFVCVSSFDNLKSIADKLNINEKIVDNCLNGKTTKYESYEYFDYISIKIPNLDNILSPSKKVCLFFSENILLFICNENELVDDIILKYKDGEIKGTSLCKILYTFFEKLTSEDTYNIEKIEQQIIELEDGLLTSKNGNYLKKIIILRKKLLKLKRYYERLLNIAEGIEENENELINEKTLKYFRMLTNRVNRLYQGINNLRDYVTQVREAYQAQVDINQNNLMKLFTVVTTIFLPLTLIAGWYGMNLKMPEYDWAYSYPVVIVISIAIVILSVAWFKKNKWI